MTYLNNINELNNALIVSSLQDGNNFPVDPNDPMKWDTSIPTNKDGTPNVTEILDRLRKMLEYLNVGNPMSFNTLTAIGIFMMNLSNNSVWSQLSPNDKAQISAFLNYNNILSNGDSLTDLISKAIIEGYHIQNGGDPAKTAAFVNYIQQLITNFAPDSMENPWILDLTISLDKEINVSPQFPRGESDFDTFAFGLGLKVEKIFTNSQYAQTVTDFFNDWRKEQIKEIYAKTSDPFLIYIMLLMLLFGQNNDDEMQIDGRGNLVNTASKYGQDINHIYDIFGKGHFNADSAKQFFDLLNQFNTHCGDARFANISPQIKTVYDAFFSTDPATGIIIPGSNPPMTVGQVYQIYMKQTPPDYNSLAMDLNTLQPGIPDPGSTTPPVTPPQYTSAINDLQQAISSITGFSQTQTTQTQQLIGTEEKLLTLLTTGLNSLIVDLNKQIMQAIGSTR